MRADEKSRMDLHTDRTSTAQTKKRMLPLKRVCVIDGEKNVLEIIEDELLVSTS